MSYVIIKDGDKSQLIGKRHCGNGNDALYHTGTLSSCYQEFNQRRNKLRKEKVSVMTRLKYNEMTDDDWVQFMKELRDIERKVSPTVFSETPVYISMHEATRKAKNIMTLINSRAQSPTLEELVKLIRS